MDPIEAIVRDAKARAEAADLAVHQAKEAENAAREALASAQQASTDAQNARNELGDPVSDLARALAWAPRSQIADVAPPRHMPRTDGVYKQYRTAFARGWLSTQPSWSNRNAAPRARAWVSVGTSTKGPEYAAGKTGTRDPAKLAAQVDEAREWLLDTLSQHTARHWLRTHGIDPETAPRLADIAAVQAGAKWHHGGWTYPGFWAPCWTMMLCGAEVAEIDTTRELLAPEEDRPDDAEILGRPPKALDRNSAEQIAQVSAWAQQHTARALRALVRRFEPLED